MNIYCNYINKYINIATLIQLNWNENIFLSFSCWISSFLSCLLLGLFSETVPSFCAVTPSPSNFSLLTLKTGWGGVCSETEASLGALVLKQGQMPCRSAACESKLSCPAHMDGEQALCSGLFLFFFFHRLHLELFHSWIKAFLPGGEKKHLNQACNNLCLLFMSLSNPSSSKKRPGCVSLPWGKAEWWIWSYCSLSFIDLLVPMDFYHWCFHFKRTLRALDCLRRIHRQLLNPHRVITTH